jgi:hypothetical protein
MSGATIARLGHEVRVRSARLGDVRAPQDHVGRVPPVGRLRHVGLVAPGLRRGGRQVGIPVVEAQADAADQRQEARPRGVGDHRHGRDRRKAHDPVGTPAAHGVHVRGGNQIGHVAPRGPHEAALAAPRLVGARLVGVLDDLGPGLHRVAQPLARLAEHLHQHSAHVGVLRPDRRVHVPRERGPARAPARLVVRHVRAVGGIVHLLGLPGHEPVLDMDAPRAGARAVHPVRGAHHAVVLPAAPVGRLPRARIGRTLAPVLGRAIPDAKELPSTQQRTALSHLRPPHSERASRAAPYPGLRRSVIRGITGARSDPSPVLPYS